MRNRLARFSFAAVVVVVVAAPSSATVITFKPTNVTAFASTTLPMRLHKLPPVRRLVRSIAVAASAKLVVTAPIGCTSNGISSFVGGGVQNFAGGTVLNGAKAFDAGVLEGYNNESCDAFSSIGGGWYNTVGGDEIASESTIAGGYGNGIEGDDSFIGGGESNLIGTAGYIYSGFSTIGGGFGNEIGGADSATIAGGGGNVVTSAYGTIAGGYSGGVSMQSGAIGGGWHNSNTGEYATIAGGYYGVVTSQAGAIGGGWQNSNGGQYGTIAGGYSNVVNGLVAVVGGGYQNNASGQNATIPGGASNVASGMDSFAAGKGSQALHTGAFVWSDDATNATTLKSSAANQLLARASGGVYLYSSANLTSGVRLSPGSGSWSSLSDRAAKMDIHSVNDAAILAKVATMPVSEWSYIAQGTGVRHVGPMAQDFRKQFQLGEDDKHISAVDEEGVALAAIKALQAEVVEKDRKLDRVARKYTALDENYTRLEKRLAAVEAGAGVR